MRLHFVNVWNKGLGLDFASQDTFRNLWYKELSSTEWEKLCFYTGAGKSEREIATLMKRSKTVIHSTVISKRDSNKIKMILTVLYNR